VSLAFIIYEVTLVHFAVLPLKLSLAVHFVLTPVSRV
jgi:hypothetical protein